jgi:hypothetical protein
MSAVTSLDITTKFNTFTIFAMFTYELFLTVEVICSTFAGLWYGEENSGYPALTILSGCCTVNIYAADISWKVISLQLKEYT